MLTLQEAIDTMHTIREHLPHIDAHIYQPLFESPAGPETFIAIQFKKRCVTTLDHPFDIDRLYQFSVQLCRANFPYIL